MTRETILVLTLCAGLAACGGGGGGSSSSSSSSPPPPTALGDVNPQIQADCTNAATYLNSLRYTSTDGATVGYAVMLQEYCAGSTTTGLPTSPDATVDAYFQTLIADGNAFTASGNQPSLLVFPDISGF